MKANSLLSLVIKFMEHNYARVNPRVNSSRINFGFLNINLLSLSICGSWKVIYNVWVRYIIKWQSTRTLSLSRVTSMGHRMLAPISTKVKGHFYSNDVTTSAWPKHCQLQPIRFNGRQRLWLPQHQFHLLPSCRIHVLLLAVQFMTFLSFRHKYIEIRSIRTWKRKQWSKVVRCFSIFYCSKILWSVALGKNISRNYSQFWSYFKLSKFTPWYWRGCRCTLYTWQVSWLSIYLR